MKFNDKFKNSFEASSTAATDSIAVYTTLTILRRMRKQLSLESMIEYIDIYLATVDKGNERLKVAVNLALDQTSISRIYRKAIDEGLEI